MIVFLHIPTRDLSKLAPPRIDHVQVVWGVSNFETLTGEIFIYIYIFIYGNDGKQHISSLIEWKDKKDIYLHCSKPNNWLL